MLVERGKNTAPLLVVLSRRHDVHSRLWLLGRGDQAFNLLALDLLAHFNKLVVGNGDLVAGLDQLVL